MKKALAWAIGFLLALVLGAWLHLDHPIVRRFVVQRVNAALAGALAGSIAIERVDHIGTSGIDASRVRILDPSGRVVLVASGVHVRASLVAIARSAVGSGELVIHLDDVTIDDAELALDTGDDGKLALLDAFAPRAPSGGGGRAVRFELARGTIAHAWVHGRPKGAPLLDADVTKVEAAITVAGGETRVDVPAAHVVTRALPEGLDVDGDVTFGLRGADLEGGVQGTVGGIACTLHATKKAEAIAATLDAPAVTAAQVRRWAPDLGFEGAASVKAEAHGTAEKLDVAASIGLGAATAHATGTVTLGDPIHVVTDIEARSVDLHALVPRLPASSLGATAHADVTVKAGDVDGSITASLAPGTFGKEAVPPAKVNATLTRGAVHATATIDEPGARTDVTADLANGVVDFEARANVADLARVPRLRNAASGSARVRATGRVRLADKTIDATATVDVRDVRRDEARLAEGRVLARLTGPLDAPSLSATLDGKDLAAGDVAFPRATIASRGTLGAQSLTIRLGGDPDATKRSPRIEARASVDLARGTFDLEDASIEGLGAPINASVRQTREGTLVRVRSRSVALGRVTRFLDVATPLRGGRVDVDVELLLGDSGGTGHATAELTGATLFASRDTSGRVDVTLDGRNVTATAHAEVVGLCAIDAATEDAHLGGSGRLDAASIARALGRVTLRGTFDLEKVAEIAKLPIARLAGVADVSLALDRRSAATARAELGVATRGLVFAIAPGQTFAGSELTLDSVLDGDAASAELRARYGDRVLLDATAEDVPFRAIANAPARARTVPLVARLVVPARPLASWPFGGGLRGDVEASVDLTGTLAAPHVAFLGRAKGLGTHEASAAALVATETAGEWDGRELRATVDVRSPKADLLHGAIDASLPIDALATWSASAKLDMKAFPLQRLAPLAEAGVRGKITGTATIAGLHHDARAHAAIAVDGLQLGDVRYDRAKLTVRAENGELDAAADLAHGDGSVSATSKLGMTWGTALAPTVDPSRPVDVAVVAKAFRLSGLQPFVEAVLVDLDGRLDANVHLAVDPTGRTPGTLAGSATIEGGVVQLASMGTRLEGAKARATMTPDGTIRIDGVEAHGVTGIVRGSAMAHLRGLTLDRASAELAIPEKQPIPLDVAGSQMGDVWGEVKVDATRPAPDKVAIAVDVPHLHVQLPLASARTAKNRTALSNVHVGVRQGDRFVPFGRGAGDEAAGEGGTTTTYAIAVSLGRDVEIRRGTTLRAGLEGKPTITRADKTSVAGQIRLREGSFQVQGKKFEIESGTVTWSGGDASNPLVVVTAGWTAGDGTRVYADFSGPLKTGKVTLRSEPARPKDEILALLIFGSADSGSYSAQNPNGNTSKASSVAGGLATQGLSDGLDELTGLDIATKIDTSNSANPRPEVEVQIARTISLQIAFVLGTPPPGANPDKTFATIDWRFARQWSLATTFGDQGSSLLDVVWQYRY